MKLWFQSLYTIFLLSAISVTFADTPMGWINTANTTAYTTSKNELEIAAAGLAINSTLDVFNYREDLIAASGRLQGDSGDLAGQKLELNYGVTEDISLFYQRQEHALKLDLGEINSVNIVDIDDALETLAETVGVKWTFYRGNLLNPDNRQSAATVELSASRNESDDFNLVVDQISLPGLIVSFRDPQTFSVAALQDEGWKGRFLYTWPLQEAAIATVWTGFGESQATSGTTSDLTSATISRFFEQSFELEESYFYLGASLNSQITPRLSFNINYEYIGLRDSTFERFPETPQAGLPGFLTASEQSEVDGNHTLKARLGYWLTPELNLSITGNLYSNQFVGVLPHYNNPLSGSFSTTPYGFAGVELVYKIR